MLVENIKGQSDLDLFKDKTDVFLMYFSSDD